jgi:hypothetical protein
MDNNKEFGWRKMPVSWQKDPESQQRIRAAPQGAAIAALKIYLAICLKAEFHETDRLPAGSAQLSLTSLCELLDLSRPMVVDGLKLLVEWNIVARIGGRPTILQIIGFDEPPYWVKLPKRPLYGGKSEDAIEALMQLPNRKRSSLHALQLYLYLASIRDKHSNMAKLSYDQGAATLGISRNHFSSAVSLLAAVGLVTVRTALEIKQQTGQNFSSNQYWLRGSSRDPYRSSPAEASFEEIEIDDTSYEEFLGDYDSEVQRLDRPIPAADARLRRPQKPAAVLEND